MEEKQLHVSSKDMANPIFLSNEIFYTLNIS